MNENAREKSIYRVTWIGSIVNFLLLVFKFIVGFLGHSSALVADAVHSLSDFITDVIVIVFVRISGKPEDEDRRDAQALSRCPLTLSWIQDHSWRMGFPFHLGNGGVPPPLAGIGGYRRPHALGLRVG